MTASSTIKIFSIMRACFDILYLAKLDVVEIEVQNNFPNAAGHYLHKVSGKIC